MEPFAVKLRADDAGAFLISSYAPPLPAALVRQKVDIRAQDDGNMLALSDSQLRALWEAAACLPIEKRGIFLVRLVAQLYGSLCCQ